MTDGTSLNIEVYHRLELITHIRGLSVVFVFSLTLRSCIWMSQSTSTLWPATDQATCLEICASSWATVGFPYQVQRETLYPELELAAMLATSSMVARRGENQKVCYCCPYATDTSCSGKTVMKRMKPRQITDISQNKGPCAICPLP